MPAVWHTERDKQGRTDCPTQSQNTDPFFAGNRWYLLGVIRCSVIEILGPNVLNCNAGMPNKVSRRDRWTLSKNYGNESSFFFLFFFFFRVSTPSISCSSAAETSNKSSEDHCLESLLGVLGSFPEWALGRYFRLTNEHSGVLFERTRANTGEFSFLFFFAVSINSKVLRNSLGHSDKNKTLNGFNFRGLFAGQKVSMNRQFASNVWRPFGVCFFKCSSRPSTVATNLRVEVRFPVFSIKLLKNFAKVGVQSCRSWSTLEILKSKL